MVRPGEVRGASAAVPPSESAFTLDVGSAMFKSAASKSRGTDGEASADDTAGPADVANMKDLEEFEGWTLPAEDGADDGGPPNAVPSYAGNFTTPVWSLSSMRFRHAIRDGGERAERLFDEMLRGAEKKIADAERRAEAAESLANERQLNASLNGASDPSPTRGPPAEATPEGKPKNANQVPIARRRHPGAADDDEPRSLETGSGGGSPRVRLPPLEFAPTLATQSGGSPPGETTAPLAPASRPLSARDGERIDGDESTARRTDHRIDRRSAAESSARSSAVSAPVRSRPESPGTKRPATPGDDDDDDDDGVNIGGAAFGFRRPAWSLTSMAARHRRVNRGGGRVENSKAGDSGGGEAPAGDGDGDGNGDEKSAPGDGDGNGDGDGDPAVLARRLAAALRAIDEAVGDHRGDARTAMRLVRDALADAKPSVDAAKRL